MTQPETWQITLNPILRLPLHFYWRLTRGMTLGVRAIATDAQGRICLVRHTYTPGWQLPGGGVEPGETAEDALMRELGEEAAIAPLSPPRLIGLFHNPNASRRDHVALYSIAELKHLETPRPRLEIADRSFFAPDALPDGTSPATLRRIAEWRDNTAPASTW